MKSTRFWILTIASILLLSIAASIWALHMRTDSVTANIYLDGKFVHSVDLSTVTTGYTLHFEGAGENIVAIEPGKIRIESATCPDQICVHQGWIADSIVPIVCLPNALVIQIEDAHADELDAIAR